MNFGIVNTNIIETKINHLVRKSKSNYFKHKLIRFKYNAKKLWSSINNLIDNQRTTDKEHITIQTNDAILTDEQTVAEKFNEFFLNIGTKLSSKIIANNSFKEYLPNPTQETIFLQPTTLEEVNNLIKQIDSSKSNDIYHFPVKLLKDSIDYCDISQHSQQPCPYQNNESQGTKTD